MLPIISLKYLFVSLIIDAREKRAFQNFDVPGAYLNTKIPEDDMILMNFEGDFSHIMSEFNL